MCWREQCINDLRLMFYIMTHSSVRIPLSTKYRDNRVEERREDVESEVEGK